jgi:chromosome segregation ATPase
MPAEPTSLQVALSLLSAARGRQQEELEELTREVKEARGAVEEANQRLNRVATKLRQATRRGESDDTTAQLMVFANAHIRLTGSLASGLRRASVVDRLLNNAETERRERQEAAEREAERQEREERRQQAKPQLSLPEPEDAFDELYGEIVDADD